MDAPSFRGLLVGREPERPPRPASCEHSGCSLAQVVPDQASGGNSGSVREDSPHALCKRFPFRSRYVLRTDKIQNEQGRENPIFMFLFHEFQEN